MTATAEPARRVKIARWAHAAIKDTRSKVLFCRGGLGAAKSTNAVVWHLYRCFQNAAPPSSPIASVSWVVAQTHGKVEDPTIPMFQNWLFDIWGMELGRHYTIRQGKGGIQLRFNTIKHEIHFKSGDRPKMLASANITHYTITEAGLQEEEVWGRCTQRARSPYGKIIQGLIEGTPEDDPLAAWYERVANFEGYDPVTGYRVFEVWTEENRHLRPSTAEYIANLRRQYAHDPQRLESYLYGRFVRFNAGTVYKNYVPRLHDLAADHEPDPNREVCLTFDFGTHPMAWVALQRVPFVQTYERRFHWVAVHEAAEDASLLDEVCVEFEEKFPASRFADTPITVYGDRSGYSSSTRGPRDYDVIRRHLRDLGFRRVEVRAFQHNPLETQSVEAANRAFSEDLVRVSPRCARLRESLQRTTWKANQRKIDKPANEKTSHHSDAFKYFAYQRLRDETGRGTQRPVMGRNL